MLMRGLPSGVRAVLTADHGMINVEPDRIIDVASTPALCEGVRIVAGETRAAMCTPRKDAPTSRGTLA